MSDLNSLAVTQEIAWSGRSKITSSADGEVTLSNAAGSGFTAVTFAGTGRMLPPQSGADAPTTTEFPTSGDWGLYTNTTTSRTAVVHNDAGTIKEVRTSGMYYSPLDYYQASDGTDYSLCFDRCFRAMETLAEPGKALVCYVPAGKYTFSGTANLPQSADADISKMRYLIEGGGAVLINNGFTGALLSRTAGTPTANSLVGTIRGLRFECGFDRDATTLNYWNLNADLDNYPCGGSPTSGNVGLHLSNADGYRLERIHVANCDSCFIVEGTKDLWIETCEFKGTQFYKKDAADRICERILVRSTRSMAGGPFGVCAWMEECDSFVYDQCIFEQGPPMYFMVWDCKDRTDCRKLTIRDMWDENSGDGVEDSSVWVRNKATDAAVFIDGWQFGGGHNIVRYYHEDDGNLVVVLQKVWRIHDNNGAFGDNAVIGQNAPAKFEKWDKTDEFPLSVVTSGGKNTPIVHLGGYYSANLDGNLPAPTLGATDANWTYLGGAPVGAAVMYTMPMANLSGNTPNQLYVSIAASNTDEPAPHWHPDLSDGTAGGYTAGTDVFYRGGVYTAAINNPTAAPTYQASDANWTYVGVAKWLPLGQACLIGAAPNSHADTTSGNPKATGTGRVTGMLYDLYDHSPLLDQTHAMFDNFNVPAGYYAEGVEYVGYPTRSFWSVADGSVITSP